MLTTIPILHNSMEATEKIFGYQPYQISKIIFNHFHSSFIMTKFQAWQEEVDLMIMKMVEAGIINHAIEISNSPTLQLRNQDEPNSSPIAFTLDHMSGGLLALVFGISLALVIFISERCYFYC